MPHLREEYREVFEKAKIFVTKDFFNTNHDSKNSFTVFS